MRYVIGIISLMISMSSFAWIDLQLTAGGYSITARLTQDGGCITTGSVSALTQTHGTCEGHYGLDMTVGTLTVTFENDTNNRGCALESMKVDVGPIGVNNLLTGQKVTGLICSGMVGENVTSEISVVNRGN